ncbi:MAG: hypothetical protein K5766_02370 [Alphaproteobacteria bacterium]|nr:hypothetical protein [Alphaproteobacteria bacterium]
MSEMTLLDIRSDYVFKRVFDVEEQEAPYSLINSILKGNSTVTGLEN